MEEETKAEYPLITMGDNYRHKGEIYNVFGTAIVKNTGEVLVVFADKTDTVYAVSIQEFFQEVEGQSCYQKVT